MVSLPEPLTYIQSFNSSNPSFLITAHSNFTYNKIFVIESFSISIITKGINYKFEKNSIESVSDYKNFVAIHDSKVEGVLSFSLPFDWANESIIVLVNASNNGRYFEYVSNPIFLNYKKLFGGLF